jgi:hypothetical protein
MGIIMYPSIGIYMYLFGICYVNIGSDDSLPRFKIQPFNCKNDIFPPEGGEIPKIELQFLMLLDI